MSMERRYSLSRRSALIRLGAAGLGLAVSARRFSAAGQASTPGATNETLPDTIRRWGEAWASSDQATAFSALYTDDAIWVDAPTGLQSEPGDVAAFVREFTAQISDIRVTVRSGFRSDDHGAAEWDFSFRYTGELPGVPAGTGQQVTWHGATIFAFDGEQIQRSIDYYDNTPFLVALDLLAGPDPVTTPSG